MYGGGDAQRKAWGLLTEGLDPKGQGCERRGSVTLDTSRSGSGL